MGPADARLKLSVLRSPPTLHLLQLPGSAVWCLVPRPAALGVLRCEWQREGEIPGPRVVTAGTASSPFLPWSKETGKLGPRAGRGSVFNQSFAGSSNPPGGAVQ